MIFTINQENSITVLASKAEVQHSLEVQSFATPTDLSQLAARWPATRLVEIFNGLPGVIPVKKFTDRATAVARIWKAVQPLRSSLDSPTKNVQDQAAGVEQKSVAKRKKKRGTEQPVGEAVPSQKRNPALPAVPVEEPEQDAHLAPQTRHVETGQESPQNQTSAAPLAKQVRAGSKIDLLLGLLRREGGATVEEMMAAAGWQKHSVRGFLAGTVNKKMGLPLQSKKGEDNVRRYWIAG